MGSRLPGNPHPPIGMSRFTRFPCLPGERQLTRGIGDGLIA
jgi:hypothetical protein